MKADRAHAPRPWRSLRTTLLLPLIFLTALVGLAGGWKVYLTFQQALEARIQAEAELLINAVNLAAETVFDPVYLQRQVAAIGGERDVKLILVAAGRTSRIIASTRLAWLGLTLDELPDAEDAERLRRTIASRQGWSEPLGRQSEIRVVRPLALSNPGITDGRLDHGAVLVELDTSPALHAIRQATGYLATWLAVLIAGIALLTFSLVTRRVLRPAQIIAGTLRRHAAGDRQARTQLPSGDEIGNLAQAMDSMFDTQEVATRELDASHAALRESEQYNRMLFENSPIGLALCRMDGVLIDINAAYAKILGRSKAETLRLSYWDVTPREYAEQEAKQLAQLEREGRYGPYEKEYLHRDGHRVPVRLAGLIVEKGGERFILSSVEDITEHQRAEAALLQSQVELKQRNGILLALNSVADRVYGSLDLQTVAEEAVDAIMQYTGSPSVAFFRLEEGEDGLLLIHCRGFSEEAVAKAARLPLTGSLSGITIAQRQVIISSDLAHDERIEPVVQQALLRQGFKSTASVPLLFGDDVVGVINLIFKQYRAFDDVERETLLAMGKTIGLAVANAIHVSQVEAEVAERQRAEQALEAEREFLRALLDNIQDGIVACDAEGTLTLFNRATQVMHGLPVESLPVERWSQHYDLFMADGKTPMRTEDIPLFRAFQGEPVQDVEMVIAPKVGRPHILLASGRAFYDAQGTKIGAVVSMHDITERRRAEQEIRALNEGLEERVRERTAELEASNQELETFSYSVSHDLRAPLRGIAGWSTVLAEDYADCLDRTALGYLARIRAQTLYMGELIDDLLTLSRVTRKIMQRETVNLSALVHKEAEALQQEEPERAVEWHIQADLNAYGDATLLRSLLQNLIGNAWKFTRRRRPARIEFGSLEQAGQRVFYVRDNGAGFNMDYADDLFVPFKRLHAVAEFPGTGVGLATTQRIVKRHGGRIWAEAAVDAGATFYFTLGAA